MKFKLEGEFIELHKLLKLTRLVASGGEAKLVISEGLVQVNGAPETRKRYKARQGDTIEFAEQTIIVE